MLKIAVFLLDDALRPLQCFLRSQQQMLLFFCQQVSASLRNMLLLQHKLFFLRGNQFPCIMADQIFDLAEFPVMP